MTEVAALPTRVASKIDPVPSGCWEWRASRNRDGYGLVGIRSRSTLAHRTVFEMLVGPIPDGLELDHLCRNRGCVNPAHLEPVTRQENLRRSDYSGSGCHERARTHCPRGHAYDATNTRHYIGSDGRPRRACRTCCNRLKSVARRSRHGG